MINRFHARSKKVGMDCFDRELSRKLERELVIKRPLQKIEASHFLDRIDAD